MKKSYHSSEVPTRLATMTRRTEEAWAVPAVGDIGISLVDYSRSELCQHRPDHVPAQQETIDGILTKGGTIPGSARVNPTTHRESLSTMSQTLSRHEVDVLIAVGERMLSAASWLAE